jgi:hypothetical protein
MATRSQVLSLFGATPEQVRQRQLEQEQDFLRTMSRDPFQSAGAAIGVGLGRLFGGKSPEMQQAEARQGVQTGVQDVLALAEQEAAQRGMAPLPQDEVSLLNRRANELQTIASGFRNLGEDTSQIENAATEARLRALQTKRELEANKIQTELRDIQLQSARGSLKDQQTARKNKEKATEGAIKWLTDNDAAAYVPLVESNIFDPSKAITAALNAKKLGIQVNEIGPYTLENGTEVIGGLTDKGQLVQATDAGWQPLSTQGVIQGRPDGGIKVEAGPVFKDDVLEAALGESPALNNIIDQYVSTPGFFERITGIDLKDTPNTERRERVVSLIFQEAKRLQKQNPKLYSDPVSALRDAASKRIGGTTPATTNTTDRFGAVK